MIHGGAIRKSRHIVIYQGYCKIMLQWPSSYKAGISRSLNLIDSSFVLEAIALALPNGVQLRLHLIERAESMGSCVSAPFHRQRLGIPRT